MAKKMLIDATHAEETRVVVVDGNKVEEFDFESENKRQLAGNIYLAKVTRVEPSLQAAFVDYGGNRHGFLAFSEIHPDYYQIPVADREALLEEERAYAESLRDEEDKPAPKKRRSRSRSKAASAKSDDAVETRDITGMDVVDLDDPAEGDSSLEMVPETSGGSPSTEDSTDSKSTAPIEADPETVDASDASSEETAETTDASGVSSVEDSNEDSSDADVEEDSDNADSAEDDEDGPKQLDAIDKDDAIESVADDDVSEEIRRPRKPRLKKYRIQEVIKVRQILLVQVVKEERGNKGAALTTYLSLAGRYCVLMPNTARGGGISRKITNAADRKKLKATAAEIDVPQGAGLIIRTAGANRTKAEIKRDYEYLQRLWEQIRELTLKSIAPVKIYEEGDLIKRSIRDLYSREIDEVFVEGEVGYRTAKDFMKMIMPSHAKNVKHYAEAMPLFARYQVESYLGAMFNPTVQLKSGGYIVIGVTEALVAIDVNSGRATKEGSIEETALKTNLEAAEEVARQLRLRDLAGLIVIDFIDMDERKNNSAVEKRMKVKLKTDRARIQVGRISGFGLMEMSRQRLRPGMIEATTQPCTACHGTGLIRSDDSLALTILRQLEEEGVRRKSREVLLKAPVGIVNFLINTKREHLSQIETRYGMSIRIEADPHMISPDFEIERFKTATRRVAEVAPVVSVDALAMDVAEESEQPIVDTDTEEAPKKKRRRRNRRRKNKNGTDAVAESSAQNVENANDQSDASETSASSDEAETPEVIAAEQVATPEAESAVEEVAPKKKTRSRRKPAKSKETSETVVDTAADADQSKGADVAEPEDKPDPKKRAPRTRKKKVAPDQSETPVNAEGNSEPSAEVVSTKDTETFADPAPEPVVTAASAPTLAPEDPQLDVAVATVDAEPKPKRRGWWSAKR